MELNYLINIVNDITNRFARTKMPYEHELKQELRNLSEFEKQIVKDKVNSIDYNIGALNVIKILKECEVTSISEYLGKINSMNEKLLIITDILDDKSSYYLLEELIDSNAVDDLLDMSMKNYVNDIIHQQSIIENEIISSTQQRLTAEHFTACILPKFLSNLFLANFNSVKELIETVTNQKDWNLEYGFFKVLSSIFNNIMPTYNTFIVKEICNLIQNEKNACWFFVLMAVGYVKEEYNGYVELKNLIHSQFNTFCESYNMSSLYKSLILSRQLYFYTANEKSISYQQWLKNNIGDLNYKLKNKAAFADIIQNLENVVPFENCLDIIQLHISCQISAPRKEYSRVLEYKQMLRSREEILLKENNELSKMFVDTE